MLVSDIPKTATVVTSGQIWSDAQSQTKYYVDPSDATLCSSRAWTAAEASAYYQSLASQQTNKATLTQNLSDAITTLIADIGVASTDPTFVAGATSLNAILGDTNANINASPAKYITQLARIEKHLAKAVIAMAKIDLNQISDANTGA